MECVSTHLSLTTILEVGITPTCRQRGKESCLKSYGVEVAKTGLEARTSGLDSVFLSPLLKLLLNARDLDMFRELQVAQSGQC